MHVFNKHEIKSTYTASGDYSSVQTAVNSCTCEHVRDLFMYVNTFCQGRVNLKMEMWLVISQCDQITATVTKFL